MIRPLSIAVLSGMDQQPDEKPTVDDIRSKTAETVLWTWGQVFGWEWIAARLRAAKAKKQTPGKDVDYHE